MKWWQYGISRGLYNAVSKHVDNNAKKKAEEKFMKELNEKREQERRHNDSIEQKRKELYRDKIDIVNQFFIAEFELKKAVDEILPQVDSWYYRNRWLLPTYKRNPFQTYDAIEISLDLTNRLIKQLDLKESDYVLNWSNQPSLNETIQYLSDNTDILLGINSSLAKKNYRIFTLMMYPKNTYSVPLTIWFRMSLIDEKKEPTSI